MTEKRPVYRCGYATERGPGGIRLRFCRNRVRTHDKRCWVHRNAWP